MQPHSSSISFSIGSIRTALVAVATLVLVLLVPAASNALPAAEFTFAPTAPVVDQPVTFTFTGSCDVAPCRIEWRWFRDGGSHLGTSMGEGEAIDYAFPAAGSYSVVVQITNATSTHGSATATHALVVQDTVTQDTYQDNDRRVRLGGWTGVPSSGATHGGYRTGRGPATLLFSGRRVRYVAITGPDAGIARVRIDGRLVGTLDLYSQTAGTRSRTFKKLSRGGHRIVVRATGGRNAASTGSAASLDEFVTATRHLDDSSARVSYGSWAGRRVAAANGGSVRMSSRAGESAGLTFTGTSLTWVTATGPSMGKARVEIDGVTVATVDTWSRAATSAVTREFSDLSPGVHSARVVVLGEHQPASTASLVVVDGFLTR